MMTIMIVWNWKVMQLHNSHINNRLNIYRIENCFLFKVFSVLYCKYFFAAHTVSKNFPISILLFSHFSIFIHIYNVSTRWNNSMRDGRKILFSHSFLLLFITIFSMFLIFFLRSLARSLSFAVEFPFFSLRSTFSPTHTRFFLHLLLQNTIQTHKNQRISKGNIYTHCVSSIRMEFTRTTAKSKESGK